MPLRFSHKSVARRIPERPILKSPANLCVVLLCVLLLTAITVLWIKCKILNTEKDQLQTSYNNLTIERDQLQTSYINLTIKSGQFQRERDEYLRRLCDLGKCFISSSSLYWMSNESKRWTDNQQDCWNKGADLVIINSKEEQEFIFKIKISKAAWIGPSDREREGEWKWVDDTPLTARFWGYTEPNSNEADEDCVLESYFSGSLLNWADYPCSSRFTWICEKKIFN
ncbi:C-type lectin domain family 4 member E-like [Clarias gariepinus]|uniref:C-type lectin domain family 4 member E-like n=1 Tax=Clarias gariepinus TaxID=13013 RepID=UPI00234C230B|nr:C-type lectin domain family 4 member E-like [Clarias gariepinus]